jgi:hypothetical protein
MTHLHFNSNTLLQFLSIFIYFKIITLSGLIANNVIFPAISQKKQDSLDKLPALYFIIHSEEINAPCAS